MARDIDRKLRATAAFLGTITRKDLAGAFRKVNPATPFDIGRADKWLQGRAQPRELRVYADWAKVLDLDRTAQWMADSSLDELLDAISERHGRERRALQDLVDAGRSRARLGPGFDLTGTFVCYSHAWSPYFRGRLLRGELSVGAPSAAMRVPATYAEVLPTGRMELDGTLAIDKRGLRLEVSDKTGGEQIVNFCLFPPSPPASVLGGLMMGTALIGPDAQPSVSRVVMIRLPASTETLRSADAYLPLQGSIAEDLGTLGLSVKQPAVVDERLTAFLKASDGGFDQVPMAAYRGLVDVFDRSWLAFNSPVSSGSAAGTGHDD